MVVGGMQLPNSRKSALALTGRYKFSNRINYLLHSQQVSLLRDACGKGNSDLTSYKELSYYLHLTMPGTGVAPLVQSCNF